MPKFIVTYRTIDEESAGHGDYAEQGYALPRGWRIPLDVIDEPIENYEMTLREALSISCFPEDSGSWFSSVDPDYDYRTGEQTFYSLHPQGITRASYNRLKRLLT